MARIDHGVFGVTPAAQQGRDPIARAPPAGVVDRLARCLKAQGFGSAGRRRIEAAPLQQVGSVDPGRPHPDQQLAVGRDGTVRFDPFQRLGRSLAAVDDDGVHAGLVHDRAP